MTRRPAAGAFAVSEVETAFSRTANRIPFCRKMRQQAAAYGLFRPATDQRHRARLDLRPDRHRLHHGLWHRRHDQFRPWRYFHDRRFYRADLVPDPGLDRPHRGSGDPADRASGIDGDHRALWLDRGAYRLPAAAALVPPRPDAI